MIVHYPALHKLHICHKDWNLSPGEHIHSLGKDRHRPHIGHIDRSIELLGHNHSCHTTHQTDGGSILQSEVGDDELQSENHGHENQVLSVEDQRTHNTGCNHN